MSLEGMSWFGDRRSDIAAQETRVIILPYRQGGLPAGKYAFAELYCVDPRCDCKRVPPPVGRSPNVAPYT